MSEIVELILDELDVEKLEELVRRLESEDDDQQRR
jgi:hypothetical protein